MAYATPVAWPVSKIALVGECIEFTTSLSIPRFAAVSHHPYVAGVTCPQTYSSPVSEIMVDGHLEMADSKSGRLRWQTGGAAGTGWKLLMNCDGTQ